MKREAEELRLGPLCKVWDGLKRDGHVANAERNLAYNHHRSFPFLPYTEIIHK